MRELSSTKVTNIERRAWSVAEVAAHIGVSRNFLLGQIQRGLLRARRLGGRVVILREDLDAYLNEAEQVYKSGAQPEQAIATPVGA